MDTLMELTALDGTVDSVIYRNEENGYTILRLTVDEGEPVTVVGCMPGASPGEGLAVQGSWIRHATYGDQFKADVVERKIPTGTKGIFEYLASGAIKGVGIATARGLVDQFGEETFSIMDQEPERLTEVKGITKKRAQSICESFRLQMGMRLLLDFLGKHELPLQLGMPLYRRYGNNALDMVMENPYLLVESEIGVSFTVADELALAIGMDGEDPQRVEAALLFELTHNLSNGHTFLPEEKLVLATQQLIGVSDSSLHENLEVLIETGEIIREQVAGIDACYLAHIQESEEYVAMCLERMCTNDLYPPDNLGDLLKRIQEEQQLTYAPQQSEAVALAASCQVMLLTGGPGTGKTTCLRGALALFDNLGLETALAAPTGRAAKRMSEACGAEATTIHRLLEPEFDAKTGRLAFLHNENDPLGVDAIIVDETSMVDISLMSALLSAIRSDCRLILVGDPDQLPSVGAGNLLSDLIRSQRIPMVRLTEIFRQATESAIVMNAHSVNRGEVPNLKENQGDFFFLSRPDPGRTAETIVELVEKRLPEKMGILPEQIQVLSPTRKHQTGTYELNLALQNAVNPPSEDKEERRFGAYLFREGDRVMQIKNNYDLVWNGEDGQQAGMGVFNGDIGHVVSIDNRGEMITVDFEGKKVVYSPDMLIELEPAYAMTVHKAQGSEYRAVILAVNDGAPMLLARGVLYTAITRARELFILVGDHGKVVQMIGNDRQQRRYSGLRSRLARGGE